MISGDPIGSCRHSTQQRPCQGAPMQKASSPAGFTNHRATFNSSHKTLGSCSSQSLLSILKVSPSFPPIDKSIQLLNHFNLFHPHVSAHLHIQSTSLIHHLQLHKSVDLPVDESLRGTRQHPEADVWH